MTYFTPFSRRQRRLAQVPAGQRIYAIGDVHGEARLLDRLLQRIAADQIGRAPKAVTLIFLGDLIDRGPRSDVVVRSVMRAEEFGLIVLKGNHEQTLVDAYRGDDEALGCWLQFGGRATLNSFGMELPPEHLPDLAELRVQMHEHIGESVIDWLDGRPVHCTVGDYFFVHAGIRPGVPLERQSEEDMLWIRGQFTASRRDHGKVIVHGHTVDPGQVELGGRRINVDTGGHYFGRLTALGLEGDDQWVIDTVDPDSEPRVEPLSAEQLRI